MNSDRKADSVRAARAARIGAAAGAIAGVVLVVVLHSLLGPPAYFVAKAVAVVLIVGAFGAFVGLLVSRARRDRKV